MIQFFKITLCILFPAFAFGQKITLTNASFEGAPIHSKLPDGWKDCGPSDESAPDTQPGWFNVTKPAKDGKTYIGLVTRDNDSWEYISQPLSQPLTSGECYDFSIYLSRAKEYVSLSRSSAKEENFNGAVILRVWGGNSPCHKKEKLAETIPVTHTDWKRYKFKLNPTSAHRYITLEAFFRKGTFFPYNGNLLVDNCSAIEPCYVKPPVEEEPPVIVKKDDPPTPDPTPTPTKVDEPVVRANPVTKIKKEDIKAGKKITLSSDVMRFQADSFNVQSSAYPALNEVYYLLKENPRMIIEIGGHTNGIPEHAYCDWLSKERAKSVAKYLEKRGIDGARLKYHGYGKRKPIASDETEIGKRKNQRVEIKILRAS